MEFTGVELADGTDLAALVEKLVADPVEKGAVGLHTVQVARAVRGVRPTAS
jgi:hypothetical protein